MSMSKCARVANGFGVGVLLVVLVVLASPQVASADDAVIRPIEDFLSQQGTFCFPDGMGGCILFVPPLENFFGWIDPGTLWGSSVDYAGLADAWLDDEYGSEVLGTETKGTVVEIPTQDGHAHVMVVLQTKNALTWVAPDGDFAASDADLLFGHKVEAVLAGAEPGLCNSLFKATFINEYPGAPLPDMIQLAAFPQDGQALLSLSIRCNAGGPLREAFGVEDGTPGRANTVQIGLLSTGSMGDALIDGFPVEFIKLNLADDEDE